MKRCSACEVSLKSSREAFCAKCREALRLIDDESDDEQQRETIKKGKQR